jgi:multidrug efflux system outer membrane protein
MGPDYQRPDVKAPATFRGDQGKPDAESLGDLGWWEIYRDPVLEKLIRTALEQNYDVNVALARVEEFRAVSGVAGLGSIPQISIGAAATQNAYSTVGPTPFPSTAQTVRNSFTPNISASYEIDLWQRVASLTAAARADLLASEFARDTTRVSVVASVASTYFTLRALDQQLAVTRRTAATREKFFELTRAQFSRGVVSGLDVSRAEASLAAARALIPRLQSEISAAETQLHILIGENPGPIVRSSVGETNFFPQPPEVPAGLPATLVERRPDLRQAEAILIGANARLKATKASLFPTISLTGSLGSTSATLGNLFTGPARVYTFGLTLLQPIIDANRNVYVVDAFTAREKAAMLQYQQTVGQAFREVADALAARQGYAEQLREQDRQVAALRTANQRVLKRYQVGYSSYFEVIDADSSLFAAELLRAQAYGNALTSLVQLYKSLGGGWQVPATELSPATDSAVPVDQPR